MNRSIPHSKREESCEVGIYICRIIIYLFLFLQLQWQIVRPQAPFPFSIKAMKILQNSIMALSLLEPVPEEYKDIYPRQLNTIRTRITRGKLKFVYHFLMLDNYHGDIIAEYLSVIKHEHPNGCKLNVAFGFILRNVETQELKFFHPSNNNMIFELPKLVTNEQEYRNLLEDLERQDVMEYARIQRPSTKWCVAKIVCMRFDVYNVSIRRVL